MSRYLNTEQAAFYLGFVRIVTDEAGRRVEVADRARCSEYLLRKRVPTKRIGRAVRVRDVDLEASLDDGPFVAAKRRSA